MFAQKTFETLTQSTKGEVSKPADLKSAAGFIHAYDLTRLLIAAIEQAGLTGDMAVDRNAIRLALENLETPVQGLVKEYRRPFSVFDTVRNIPFFIGSVDFFRRFRI